MKAFILKEAGQAENLLEKDVAKPTVKNGEVLVKVSSISINPIDAIVRANRLILEKVLFVKNDEPDIILGWDISGTVVETNDKNAPLKIGDEIFGMVNFTLPKNIDTSAKQLDLNLGLKHFIGHGKAYAEYVAAPTLHLTRKPKGISHEAAAAATLTALTAYQSFVKFAKVKSGDKVLIHSAAGGVGHYAVQIAKYLGAYVIGTGSAENKNFILSLGADEFLDYKNQVFEEVITDASVVLDGVTNQPNHLERSLKALKTGGRLISMMTLLTDDFSKKLKVKNVYGHRVGVESNGEDMAQIAEWLDKGILKSHVSQVFEFKDLPKSHLQIETGKTKGKIVVNL